MRRFNEFDRDNGERKASCEIIEYEVPQIIDRATFDAVQALLVSRQPRSRGPRLTSAPSLLGGLIRCDCAQSCALTTATGTSRNGTIHAYYKCLQAIKQGRHKDGNGATCANRKIPRPTVEKLVVNALLDQLLQPERVRSILTTLKARQDERQASADRRMVDLARQAADAEERLTRLYGAIEAGTVDGTDPTLRERVASLKNARDRSIEALDYAKKSSVLPIEIDPIVIERFTRLMRERLVSRDAAARKAYLAAIIDSIVVSENTIRITGSNDNLRSTLGPDGQPVPVVRKSVQEWCPGAGSNHRHCDFQSHALPTELPGRRGAQGPCERRVIVRQGGPVHPATPAALPGAASLRGPLSDGSRDGKSTVFACGQAQPKPPCSKSTPISIAALIQPSS
jgi:site-specific DNA recombinase